MQADILGSISDIGVFQETGEGSCPTPDPSNWSRPRTGGGSTGYPTGVFLDWQQFQAAYKDTRSPVDPTGKTVVPDPATWRSPIRICSRRLVNKLLAGPRPEMANAVRNLLGPRSNSVDPSPAPTAERPASARGYGGARIDLENLTTTDPASRLLVAAQLIWTLARSGRQGPYLINVDGAPLDDRFVDGWKTTDVAATDPGAVDGAPAGCTR